MKLRNLVLLSAAAFRLTEASAAELHTFTPDPRRTRERTVRIASGRDVVFEAAWRRELHDVLANRRLGHAFNRTTKRAGFGPDENPSRREV